MKKTNSPILKSCSLNIKDLSSDKNIQYFLQKNRNYTKETHKFFCDSQTLTARLKTEDSEDKTLDTQPALFNSPRGSLKSLCSLKKRFMELNHSINLENHNLSHFPMQYYGKMSHTVRILDLSNNKIKSFPEEILIFIKLESLKLDNNSIPSIPVTLFSNLTPKYFSISNNYIKIIPIEISKWSSSLEYLNISGNFISQLPAEITYLTKLKSLHINNNSFASIPIEIRRLTFLKELGLDWFKYLFPTINNVINSLLNKQLFNMFFAFLNEKVFEKHVNSEIYLKEFFDEFRKKSTSYDFLPEKLVFEAAFNEDLGILRFLITEYCEKTLNIVNQLGHSPLSYSIKEEKYLSAKLLIQSGCNVNVGGGDYGSPLNLGIMKIQLYLIKDLMKYGANPNLTNKNGDYSLSFLFQDWESENDISIKIFKLLMENNTGANRRNQNGLCPIHVVLLKKMKEPFNAIIEYNNSINYDDDDSNFFDFNKKTSSKKLTCLHLAVQTEDFEIVSSVLTQKGVPEQLFEKDLQNNRPIHFSKKNYTIIKFLRKHEKKYISNNILSKITSKYDKFTAEEDLSNLEDESQCNLNLKMKKMNILNIKNSNFKSSLPKQNKIKLRLGQDCHKTENLSNNSSIDSLKTDLDEENNAYPYNLACNSYRKIEVKRLPISPNNIRKIERIQQYSNYFTRSQSEKNKLTFNSFRKLDLEKSPSLEIEKKAKNIKPTGFLLSNVYKNLVNKFDKYRKEIEEFHEEILANGNLLSSRLFFLFQLFKIQHKILKIATNLIEKGISLAIVNANLFESSQLNEEQIKENSKNTTLQTFHMVFLEICKILNELDKKEGEEYNNFFIKYEIFTFCSFFNVSVFKEFYRKELGEIIKFELALGLLQFNLIKTRS